MISVKFMGQIGNQLFQYLVGKILAEKTGLMYPSPPSFLDKGGHPVRWSGKPIWKMTPTPGIHIMDTERKYHLMHVLDWDAFDPTCKITITHGYFQKWANFRAWKDRIRNEWLPIPRERFVETDDEAVYVHVRRTDYVNVGNNRPPDRATQGYATSIEEFRQCLTEFPDAKRLVIVTDAPRDRFIQLFDQLLPSTVSGRPWDEDFLLLASARNLLMSQSTFSWWAGFLGRAQRIVCPIPQGTFWQRGITEAGFPHLYVDEEPERWIWKSLP